MAGKVSRLRIGRWGHARRTSRPWMGSALRMAGRCPAGSTPWPTRDSGSSAPPNRWAGTPAAPTTAGPGGTCRGSWLCGAVLEAGGDAGGGELLVRVAEVAPRPDRGPVAGQFQVSPGPLRLAGLVVERRE